MDIQRRQMVQGAGLSLVLKSGGVALPVTIASPAWAQLRRERWMAPSRITLLQAYVFVAAEEGYFKDQGLDVQIQDSGGTATSITQVAAGTVSFGQSAPISTCPAIADRGLNVITIGQMAYNGFFEIASLPGKPMRHPKDWQGKTIGLMSVGGTTDYLLDAMSISQGLDPKNVKKVVTGLGATGMAFLQRGEVDGFFVFYETKVGLNMQGAKLEYLHTDTFAKLPGDALIVSTNLANDPANEKMLAGYLRACSKAVEFVLNPANEDKVLGYLKKYNPQEGQQMPKNREIMKFVRGYITPPSGIKPVVLSEKDWTAGLKMMRDIGMIKDKSVPDSRFFTNKFAAQI